MTQRQVTLLYLATALVLLALMAAQVQREDSRSALGNVVRALTAPVVGAVAWTGSSLSGAWRGYVALRGAEEENRRLRREIALLRARLARREDQARRIRRLQALLDLRQVDPFRGGVVARVVSYVSEGPLSRAVVVDRGRRWGVSEDWIALQGPAVVGRIVHAGSRLSELMLISDPDSGVAVRHQDERFAGILRGGNRGPAHWLPLEYVPKDKPIAVGDEVVTSGLDGLYPPGLLVGWVRSLEESSPLTWSVAVEPAFDASRLEEVLLLPPVGAAGREARSGEAVEGGAR
ncbi:MAG: rod shape-determining protein MreC [Acidobacteriota bacterium]|nr:rod shape-determining protein MreC [Acidobacteriota bacterium]MDQ7088100.1 rod shape-determining protein MreC [Acidobacteriota bacterium]